VANRGRVKYIAPRSSAVQYINSVYNALLLPSEAGVNHGWRSGRQRRGSEKRMAASMAANDVSRRRQALAQAAAAHRVK